MKRRRAGRGGWRRAVRVAAALMLGALLTAPWAVVMAQGATESTIGGYGMRTRAPGMEFTFEDDSTQGPQTAGVPEASTEADTGGSHALASVAWPGNIGGNFGTTSAFLFPAQVAAVLNSTAPGTTRTACPAEACCAGAPEIIEVTGSNPRCG